MRTIRYTAMVGFMFATILIAWAGYIPSAQELYDAWRVDAGLQQDDGNHFYLSATVLSVENGRAIVRVGVGGAMESYTLNVTEALRVGAGSEYMPVGKGRTLVNAFNGFADLNIPIPVSGSSNGLLVMLRPKGSFDDARSLGIYLPVQARPEAMTEVATLAAGVKASCPTGCFLFSHTFTSPPCPAANAGTQYICCKHNQFVVDATACTISCYYANDSCPVIISADTVKTPTGLE